MSKRKPYMHKHFLSMMRIDPSADTEGRHSEGKKPYSFKRASYKQMEDLDFKDLTRFRKSKTSNPCSGHRSLNGGFIPLSIDCDDGIQEVQFAVSEDFVNPVIVADEDGLSFNNKPIEKNTIQGITTGFTLMSFDPESFSGDDSEVICIEVFDAECGGSSIFCMFLIGCGLCAGADCDLPSISCAEGTCQEITSSSSKTYSLDDAQGSVSWEVSGTGASIDQSGVLTTTGAACGTLTITATDSCCGEYTLGVRVTSAGFWVIESSGYSSEFKNPWFWPDAGRDCTEIRGVRRYYEDSVAVSGNPVTHPSNNCTGPFSSAGQKFVEVSTWECAP